MPRLLLAARLIAGASLIMLAAPLSHAQTSIIQGTNAEAMAADIPRTPDGHPDFQGAVWTAEFFGMLEAIPMMLPPELVVSEEKGKQAFDRMLTMFMSNPMIKEAAKYDPEVTAALTSAKGFPIVHGERRTRLLALPADGKIPYTPEARKEAAAAMNTGLVLKADNPEERMVSERCNALGAGPLMAIDFNPRQFIQTPDHVVIQAESGDDIRIVPFVRGVVPAGTRGGDALAHWEGDTLVIETTRLPASSRLQLFFPVALIINPEAKVIERFTRLGGDELLYQFTVEDPTVYTAPWMAEFSFFRAPFRMYPGGCHEANYSLANILSGQRAADARAIKVAGQGKP